MHIPAPNISVIESAGFQLVTNSGRGTALTYGGALNTKGAWVQLVASTARDSQGFWVYVWPDTGATGFTSVDIGIGAAASETVIAPDLFHGKQTLNCGMTRIFIPLSIPAGTRVAARAQTSVANQTPYVHISLCTGELAVHGRATTYGFTAASTTGVTLDPGGSAYTKGSYAEIAASTSNDIKSFYVLMTGDGTDGGTSRIALDVAVGAAASEVIIVPDHVAYSYTGGINEVALGPFYHAIPAGSRIAARVSATNATVTQRNKYVTLIGFD